MNAAAGIAFTAVTRTFPTAQGRLRALDEVSFRVAPGSSVAVMGPSGGGKSTLLALVGGLDTPSAGTVEVGGHLLSHLDRRRRTQLRRRFVGFVFQSYNLLPFLTAAENVAFQLALAGERGAGRTPAELLADVGLAAHADKLPDQLSGGQRQRVAVAATVARSPALILADEPTGSLDRDNVHAVVDLLEAAQRRTGATLLLVSHDPEVCRRMSRILTLHHGRLVGDTAPEPAPRGAE